MARGKYAAGSAARREALEVESAEAAYRRQIVRLTEERDSARIERDTAMSDWRKEVRILRAQLSEGASPRVDALTQELNRVREERDRHVRERRQVKERYKAGLARLIEHFETEHSMKRAAAMDAAYSVLIGVPTVVTLGIEDRVDAAFGPEAVLAMRKARGQ